MAPGTVLAAFSVLKDHVKFKVNQNSIAIDNIVFRLHYRATFLLLLVACILVTSRQFIGEHIRCVADSGVPSHVIETFCFFMSTYTVVKHLNATAVLQGELPHLGVGPVAKDDPVIHHAYYQWVPFILFFQALLFYLPHYLWRKTEGGRLSMLVSGLHMASLLLSETEIKVNDNIKVPSKKERDEKIQQIRIGFINRLHLNRPWAYGLAFCEILNFINVIMQIYLTDWFLGGAFLSLGRLVSEPVSKDKMDPLDVVFPKVTKCIFHKYGPSGTIQKHDALCVMALNIVNEKIYTVLWFWFIVLAVITGLGLLWRLLTMILHARSTSFNKLVFSIACPGKYNPWNVLKVTHEYYFGDWLFLYYIAKNLDNYIFKELLQSLAEDLENKRHARFKILPLDVEQELLKKQWGDDINSPVREHGGLLSSCGCIPRNLRVRTDELESSTTGTLSIIFSVGREMTRDDEKKRGGAGKPCVCVSVHLDVKPIGPASCHLFLLFYAVKPGWIKPAVAIDRHNIRSGYFRNNGYLYNEVYLATRRTKHVSRARTSEMIANEHGDSQNRYCQQ